MTFDCFVWMIVGILIGIKAIIIAAILTRKKDRY